MSALRNVPFFNYPAQFVRHEDEIMALMRDVMRRGAFINQKDLREFEESLAKFLNVKHAFGMADGTESIQIALIASGIKPGDEVLVPSHTFIATAAAIHWTGAKPVLVDCGRDHMMDPASAEAAITSKTRGIVPVQLNGRTADMDAIMGLVRKHNLILVEDAAQALGSKFKDKHAGTFGSAGTFSFYPAKLLGCYGDGGGLVTNDDKVAAKVFMLRDHGRDPEGKIQGWGFNCRLDNLQAAVLSFKLKTFPQDIERRREIAAMYQKNLGDLKQLQLPPAPNADSRHFDVYQNYELEAERRDELKDYLDKNGIKTLIQWGGSAIHQFSALGFKNVPSYTEQMFKRCLMLPMNTTLSNDDVDYVSETVRAFYQA